MNLICKYFGHKWKYNAPNILASKKICKRCYKKMIWKGNISGFVNLWTEVLSFKNEKRPDKELIEKWFE